MTPSKTDLKGILLFLENLYPLTIITDRYHGTYSGGEYLAFPLLHTQIPAAVCGNDSECLSYWQTEDRLDYLIGKGNSPSNAIHNLIDRYSLLYIQEGGLPEDICDLLGHDLAYNFPSSPTRAHCTRCGKKFKADYSGDILHDDIWKEIEKKKRPARIK